MWKSLLDVRYILGLLSSWEFFFCETLKWLYRSCIWQITSDLINSKTRITHNTSCWCLELYSNSNNEFGYGNCARKLRSSISWVYYIPELKDDSSMIPVTVGVKDVGMTCCNMQSFFKTLWDLGPK